MAAVTVRVIVRIWHHTRKKQSNKLNCKAELEEDFVLFKSLLGGIPWARTLESRRALGSW